MFYKWTIVKDGFMLEIIVFGAIFETTTYFLKLGSTNQKRQTKYNYK